MEPAEVILQQSASSMVPTEVVLKRPSSRKFKKSKNPEIAKAAKKKVQSQTPRCHQEGEEAAVPQET